MELITIDNSNYGFVNDFVHDHEMRASLNELTEVIFNFNFENWYSNGYWNDKYIPYALLHENKVISNVSINKMEIVIENEKKEGIQIGTVMTHKEYQNRGLSKFLMQQVINEWKGKCDFIYLFANDSVLDFYPKFDFETVNEFQYSKPVNTSKTYPLKKLNMEDRTDRDFLVDAINMSIPISKISMRNNASLIMFYCMSYKKNSVYYIEKFNVVVIADVKGDTLYLNDVFSRVPIDLHDLIQFIANESIKRVVLGFTPLNEARFNRSLLNEGDKLFILKGPFNYFKNNHCMFPILSHA